VIVLALALMMQAAHLPVPEGKTVMQPDWQRHPSRADLAIYYPNKAQAKNVTGSVTIDCDLTQKGSLSNCRVVAEQPPGWGFGETALKLSKIYKIRPTTAAGVPLDLARIIVRIPLSFGLPNG
jgi:periplasmic protein TonB